MLLLIESLREQMDSKAGVLVRAWWASDFLPLPEFLQGRGRRPGTGPWYAQPLSCPSDPRTPLWKRQQVFLLEIIVFSEQFK